MNTYIKFGLYLILAIALYILPGTLFVSIYGDVFNKKVLDINLLHFLLWPILLIPIIAYIIKSIVVFIKSIIIESIDVFKR